MKGYHVLVVDDAEDVHDVVGTYLELSGYRVSHAMNGAEGLERALAELPDLVILDVQMPVMDGFATLESLRRAPTLRDTPVLFLSSLDRPNLKVKGLQLGADDYIVKPFDRAELLARVGRALQRGERFRRLEQTLAGTLEQISLAELLQTLEIGHKSARIDLPDLAGELVVRHGELTGCRWRAWSGRAALARLLLLEWGRFAVEFAPAPATWEEPPMVLRALLLDLAVDLDEVRLVLAEGQLVGASLSDSGGAGELPGELAGRLPMTVDSARARLPGYLHRNAEARLAVGAWGRLGGGKD